MSSVSKDARFPTEIEVGNRLQFSGRLTVKERDSRLVLWFRTYPLLVFIWCALIMGGFTYVVSQAAPELIAFAYVATAVGVTLFTCLSLVVNRKSVFEFDPADRVLHVPREKLSFDCSKTALGYAHAEFVSHGDRTIGVFFYVIDEMNSIPVFFAQSKSIGKLGEFAAKSGIELVELPHKVIKD